MRLIQRGRNESDGRTDEPLLSGGSHLTPALMNSSSRSTIISARTPRRRHPFFDEIIDSLSQSPIGTAQLSRAAAARAPRLQHLPRIMIALANKVDPHAAANLRASAKSPAAPRAPSSRRRCATCTAALGEWMRELGMEVSIDAAGNLRGLRAGAERAPPDHRLASRHGSERGRIRRRPRRRARHRARRSARTPSAGSASKSSAFPKKKACVSAFPSSAAARWPALSNDDPDPARPRRHPRFRPGSRLQLPAARFSPDTIGYLEFHIEQGPVLESLDLPLGIVDAIAGQSRFNVDLHGQSQPRRHHADAPAPRRAGRRGGMDRRCRTDCSERTRPGRHRGIASPSNPTPPT